MFKINHYFDNHVSSIAFQGEQTPATVGVIAAGEYAFDTSQDETMTIISGQLSALLPHAQTWTSYQGGEQFKVPANSTFKVKCTADTAYLCTYHEPAA